MPKVYDDWDRLVRATLRRQELWELCHAHSRTTSGGGSTTSGGTPGSTSPIDGAAIRHGIANFENQAYRKRNDEEERNWGKIDEIEGEGEETVMNMAPCLPAVKLAYYRSKKPYDRFFDVPAEADIGQLKRFSLRELQVATENFSDKCFLGRGDFGKVYKGRLVDGSLVAVKRMKNLTQDREVQFQREVETIELTAHRNLLSLRGFCMTPTERILVYPYMANGCVELWLREPPERPLNWPTRKRVALGSARGLVYLHDHCDPQIIHRDVKAANILLDYDFEAVVGDFGLAILMDTHVTSVVCGTNGHIAPEYLSTGKVSEKIDVYGYGIMLLELITGLRALELVRLASDDGVMLLDWVNGLVKEERLETLVDADLRGYYNDEEVEQLIQVALLCILDSPEERPKMSEVVRMLEGDGPSRRWEGWQEIEMVRKEMSLDHCPVPTTEWIIDSISNIRGEELSGPR